MGRERKSSLAIQKRRFSLDEMSLRSLSLYLYRKGITGKNGKRLTVGTIKTALSPSGYAKASRPAWETRLEADDIRPNCVPWNIIRPVRKKENFLSLIAQKKTRRQKRHLDKSRLC